MSAWLPSETKRENPRPTRAAFAPISSARLPLWEMKPIAPRGRSSETSSSSAPASKTPRQLGPSRRAPPARAIAATAASRAPPASPSRSLPEIATIARAPAATASATPCSSAAAGTERTARSIASGSSASARWAGWPSTVPPRRLTKWTARRCAPRCARNAIQWPHFTGSSDAPTTATERGSKSVSRPARSAIGDTLAVALISHRAGLRARARLPLPARRAARSARGPAHRSPRR